MYEILSKLPIVKQSRQGKVRDMYDLGETVLMVTSDRISAFDVVFPDPIPGKGIILNQIAAYVFKTTSYIVPNHFITDRTEEYPAEFQVHKDYLEGRSMLVQKLRMIPVECIVRGYISGSAWNEYSHSGTVGGEVMPSGLKENQKLPQPIFTPSVKITEGHDINISYQEMLNHMDKFIAEFLRDKSLALYDYGYNFLLPKGIILADTKFEFGTKEGEILLADEALTPDSSRFWDLEAYNSGKGPVSFDKQIVRDYLESIGWNKKPPAPHLPEEIIDKALAKYREVRDIFLGEQSKQ